MKIMLTETWQYAEYVIWNVESLPEGWDEMGYQDKADWVVDHGEFYHLESEPMSIIRVEDVEVMA